MPLPDAIEVPRDEYERVCVERDRLRAELAQAEQERDGWQRYAERRNEDLASLACVRFELDRELAAVREELRKAEQEADDELTRYTARIETLEAELRACREAGDALADMARDAEVTFGLSGTAWWIAVQRKIADWCALRGGAGEIEKPPASATPFEKPKMQQIGRTECPKDR